ncbi:hypothetical protein M569_05879, partial [Genlisea aurea]
HRRARAIHRFRIVVSSGTISEVITNEVFIPLLFSMLYEAQDGKDEHIKSACIEALAAISGLMKWNQCYAFLIKCFRELTLKSDKQKTLLKLIGSVLDHFRFSELSSIPEDAIQMCVQKKLLPKIQKLLASDSENINANVSLVALKLLKLLPSETMELHIPTIVHRISGFLKHRLESVRDNARSALAACLHELGVEYLQFVLKSLRGALRRGSELHILGYTLNFLLSKVLVNPNTICGMLDYCLDDILSVIKIEILGDVSEEKEVDKIASKMKETKKQKSYETLKLTAQTITFKNHALKLLSLVTAHLNKELTPKVMSRLQKMLNHIAAGIQCNPSANQTELFTFIYGLVKDGLDNEGLKFGKRHVSRTGNVDTEDKSMLLDQPKEFICVDGRFSHLITAFALGLLHSYLDRIKIKKDDEELMKLLDGFVSLLVRCLSLIVWLPLHSLQAESDEMKRALLVIAQGSVNAKSELTDPCLKLLATLLHSSRVTLSNDQLCVLIQLPLFLDLSKTPSFTALKLLKAIVHRKLVVPEIFDVIQVVAELMVQNQSDPIRKKCSEIMLQFLLGYPLSNKRLQQNLDFLLANLRYEHSTGRESVLEMLHAIILKFPLEAVDAQSQILFVHLVAVLANDDSSKVRSMTASAIKCLIGHVGPHSRQYILDYALSWYVSSKQNLWATSAQVLGLLVEVMRDGFKMYVKRVFPVMKNILQSAAGFDSSTEHEHDISDHTSVVPFWKEAYYSLVLFEKILREFPDLIFDMNHEVMHFTDVFTYTYDFHIILRTFRQDMWESISDFLLHPHPWLRDISSRIYSIYFASGSKENDARKKSILTKPGTLFHLASSFLCQLKKPQTDGRSGNAVLKNLELSIYCLDSLLLRRNGHDDDALFWSNLETSEKARFGKGFDVLDRIKGRSALVSITCSSNANRHRKQWSPFICYFLQRMGTILLHMEPNEMKITFKCIESISSRLLLPSSSSATQDDDLPPPTHDYAYLILLPLYKVCEGHTGKVIPDDVKREGEEAMDKVRDVIGMRRFVHVRNEIRKCVEGKRDKRKREHKIMAVVNPTRHAKRKLRLAAKHRDHKRRKV